MLNKIELLRTTLYRRIYFVAYKGQMFSQLSTTVNNVQESNCSFFYDSNETHKYTSCVRAGGAHKYYCVSKGNVQVRVK